MKEEYCLVIIKPDGIRQFLFGEIFTYIANGKYRIVGAKAVRASKELLTIFYAHQKQHPNFGKIIEFMEGKWH